MTVSEQQYERKSTAGVIFALRLLMEKIMSVFLDLGQWYPNFS